MRKLEKYPSVPRPHPETDPADLGCGFQIRRREFLLAVQRYSDARVVDIELEPDPFVVCNVGPGLVAPVRVFLAQPVEFPVGIGKVLDRALVARGGWVCLSAIEWTQ